MTKLTLRLQDALHTGADRWADRDGMSLNEWIADLIDREIVRRDMVAHNEFVKNNPALYNLQRWQAEQDDIAGGSAK